jgi:Spy/CpxP family protein refolding chaperone
MMVVMRRAGLTRAAAVAALALVVGVAPAAAQQGRQGRGDDAQSGRPTQAQSAEAERRFHERVAQIVQRELRLTPQQTQRLRATSQEFDGRRRPLFVREVQIRRALRQELAAGDRADQERVEGYLRELLQLQRRRLDVVEAEQRALADFLTPVQRARYLSLQENLRARVEQQRGRPGRRGPGPASPPAPTPPPSRP